MGIFSKTKDIFTKSADTCFEINDYDQNLNELPDAAKSYLFRVEFEFPENLDISQTEKDNLMLRANAINIVGFSQNESYYPEYCTHKVEDSSVEIQFDEFDDFAAFDFFYTNFNKLTDFTINVKLYNSTLTKVTKIFRYNHVKLTNVSSLVLDTNSDQRIKFRISVVPESITNFKE